MSEGKIKKKKKSSNVINVGILNDRYEWEEFFWIYCR